MLKNLNNLKPKEYKTYNDNGEPIDVLNYLESLCSEFEDYDSKYDICDVISEIADDYTPIYYNEIWDKVYKIKEWADEYIKELGELIEDSLDKTFKYCIYRYLEDSMYENIEELIYNTAIYHIDNIYGAQSKNVQEKLKEISEDDVIEVIRDIDVNSKHSDIIDAIDNFVESLNEGDEE